MADSGEGPLRPGPHIFRPTEARRAKKICFGDQAPPYLRVWMTGPPSPLHCMSRSGSVTVVHDKLFQCLKRFIYLLYKMFYLWQLSSIDRYFLGILAMFLRQKFGYIVFHLTCLHHWVTHDHFLGDIWGNYEGKWGQKELFLLVLCSPLSLGKA